MYLVNKYLVSVSLLGVLTLTHQQLTKDGIKCDCMKSQRCKYWVSAVSRGKYLDLPVCGYDHHTLAPLLCCPRGDVNWISKVNRTKREIQSLQGLDNIQLSCTVTSHNLAPAKIANQKCDEYGQLIFQSLYEVSVGGSPVQKEKSDTCAKADDEYSAQDSATPREFPHMALIGYNDEDIKWLCAGSLISERFILSAAACSHPRKYGPAKWAKMGDLDVSTDEDVARPQLYKISDIIIHPEYKEEKYYNDIALYKLDRDVTFTIYVRPVCLFTRRDPPDNNADATGWGERAHFEKTSPTLKKIKMVLVNTDDCKKVYNNLTTFGKLSEGLQANSMICAEEAAKEGAQICTDMGAPLQIPLKKPYCMYGVIGLTSFGFKCGRGAPTVFTRVSHYVPWIVENVWSE